MYIFKAAHGCSFNTNPLLAVLGSGGMIFQCLNLLSAAIYFDECPESRTLALTVADLFVSGLQVLFLVKFLSVGRHLQISLPTISSQINRDVTAWHV